MRPRFRVARFRDGDVKIRDDTASAVSMAYRIEEEFLMSRIKQLHINGAMHPVDADPDRPLLSVLRDDLDLTGAKYGCGEGQCGACTVLLNGQPIRSCITPVGTVAGKSITTIEGLEQNGRLH